MKKFKILSAIALAGLVGLTARAAAPANFDIVSLKLTALVQTNIDTKIVKIKITTKDLLKMVVAPEFTNKAAQITGSGAKLVVDSFQGGTFAVLDKTNGVIVADAGSSPTNDEYELFIENDGFPVQDIKDNATFTDTITTTGFFEFDNGPDTIFGEIFGLTIVKQTESNTKESESFKLTGADETEINGAEGTMTGSVSGSGKDNDDVEFFD
jgi:hypothetical protein